MGILQEDFMKTLIKEMLDQNNVWAVVGATVNQGKFGYKILRRLQRSGYVVYPVNPVYDEIEGEKCYNSLKEIEGKVDCINMVVSPKRSRAFIDEAAEIGIKKMWFQPGAYDNDVIEYAVSKGLEVVYGHCVLVELSS